MTRNLLPRRFVLVLASAAMAAGLSLTGAASASAASLSDCTGTLLQQGSSGACVTALQQALDAHGANIAADGQFGPLTNQAVRTFQGSAGLSVDGIAGPNTDAALLASTSAPAPAPAPAPLPPNTTTVQGQSSFPDAETLSWHGAHDCGFIAPQIVEGKFYNPQARTAPDGTQVVADVVKIETNNSACGDSVTATLQTRVCDIWNCGWHDIAGATWTDNNLPANGEVISPLLTGKLRAGTNSYRLELDATSVKIDAEDEPEPGIIAPVRETETTDSNVVKLTSNS